MGADQVAKLKRAVVDARLLLEFAVRTDKPIDDKVLDEVMTSIGELGDLDAATSVPVATEARFWKAFQQLTLVAYPVTADSIEASKEESAKRWSTTTTHSIVAGVIFLILAFLQVTWVTGTTLRKEFDDLEPRIVKLEASGRPMAMEVDRLRRELMEMSRPLPAAESAARAARPETAKRRKEIEDELAIVEPKSVANFSDYMRLVQNRQPVLELLQGWYEQVTFNQWPMRTERKIKELEKRQQTLAKGTVAPEFQVAQWDQEWQNAQAERAIELSRRVDLILQALQNYVFPTLLGLLGALTYILRSLIVQLREYWYTRNFSRLSFVRVALGMMAGLLGSMIIPSGEGVIDNLSPLALSFLLGYAVEVLFSFLDRIVTAFTAREQPRTAA